MESNFFQQYPGGSLYLKGFERSNEIRIHIDI